MEEVVKKKTVKKKAVKKDNKKEVKDDNKEIKKESKKKCNCLTWAIAISVIALLTVGFVIGVVMAPGSDKVDLELYVMSQCPYGTQAEEAVIGMMDALGDNVNLDIIYIGNTEGGLDSLHGQPEVLGDIIQLCVNKYHPDKYLDFITCQNKNYQSIPNNWQSCANSLGFNMDKLGTCYSGGEGVSLVTKSFKKSEAGNIGSSPTIKINGEDYSGDRDDLSIAKELCNRLGDISACNNLPECRTDTHCSDMEGKVASCQKNKCVYIDPAKFDLIILNDKTCATCDPSEMASTFVSMFKGVSFISVDINTTEGQKLIDDLGIIYAPAFIAKKEITGTYLWNIDPRFNTYFNHITDYYVLDNRAVGATHFVDKELEAKFFESIGVELDDNKPQIDFFVMSYCPYGNQAEEAIYEVYKNMGDSVEYKPHYIYYPGYQGGGADYCFDAGDQYCSMHGVQEANQNVREQCVLEEYGIEKWFEFAVAMNTECTSKNADACWVDVATGLSIDTVSVESCYSAQKDVYGAEDIRLAALYGATGSPNIYVDGTKFGGSISANGYQAALCGAFEDAPAECDNVVVVPTQQAPAPAGGCGV